MYNAKLNFTEPIWLGASQDPRQLFRPSGDLVQQRINCQNEEQWFIHAKKLKFSRKSNASYPFTDKSNCGGKDKKKKKHRICKDIRTEIYKKRDSNAEPPYTKCCVVRKIRRTKQLFSVADPSFNNETFQHHNFK